MFETALAEPRDPGTDLASAALESARSAVAVRATADAVELQAIATLARLRRTQAVTAWRDRRERHSHARDDRERDGRERDDRARDSRSRDDRTDGSRMPVSGLRVDLDLVDRCTAQELSVALWLSPVVARDRLELALELVDRRPATFEALRTGAIDLVRARRITDAVRALPADSSVVDDEPAPDGGLSLAAAVEAEVLRPGSVPLLADVRPGRPAGQLTPAQLTARLARLVLRADPSGALDRTTAADAWRGCTLRALPDGMALLSVTARAELLAGAFARIDATARRLLAADRGSPAGTRASSLIDAGAAGPAAEASTAAPDRLDPARGLDAARVDVVVASLLGTSSDLGVAPGVTVEVALVAPADTVLAGSDDPGELVGYGPLPAPLVRALAADARWRRWTTDPVDGQVTAVGRRTYRPSAAVADLVRARDQTCRFPTCRRAARACDLDHVVPFPTGDTHPSNLAAECRLHHLAKHRGGFGLRIDAAGTAVWTTPTGEQVVDQPPVWGQPPPSPAVGVPPPPGPPVGSRPTPDPPVGSRPPPDPPPF